MFRKALTLINIALSFSAQAAIVDLGQITRDTNTGMDWLDLTKTNGRSYNDVASKLGAGQELSGWRYATLEEVRQLWITFGVTEATDQDIAIADTQQLNAYHSAIDLLGNTYLGATSTILSGVVGFTADTDPQNPGNHFIRGMYELAGLNVYPVRALTPTTGTASSTQSPVLGSYLVRTSEVPLPATTWLLGSALIGIGCFKKRTNASNLSQS